MRKRRLMISVLSLAVSGCATVITEPDAMRMIRVCQTPGADGSEPVIRLYGGKRGDGTTSGQSLAADGAGGYVIAGVTQGLGSYAGNTDLLLAGIGSAGTIQWAQVFGGPLLPVPPMVGTSRLATATVTCTPGWPTWSPVPIRCG